MKKRIASLLLALPLCLTLLPTTALAEDEAASDRTVIATVEDLQQFARAVDAGDYDGKTDAVVELAADLDLTGIEWTPIGSTVNADGEVEHCFSGKFYGQWPHCKQPGSFGCVWGNGSLRFFWRY